jgi:transcriptional regulator with XRE-family HTH domain
MQIACSVRSTPANADTALNRQGGEAQGPHEQVAASTTAIADRLAANLLRIMARQDLSVAEVVDRAGLDARTVRALLAGRAVRPHAHTLHRLAAGLEIEADELFAPAALLARRRFDRATNPVVDELTVQRPDLFEGWTEAEFDELHSRFGAGGALTAAGALDAVQTMNRNRAVHERVAVLLESGEGELLCQIVEALYRRVLVRQERSAAS